jgi:hypothetical protein
MSTKQLEIATDVCILVGMFLLAIPSLFGVENTVRWLLRRRERLLRIQRYLTLADKEVIVGTPDIRDLKKEDEGKAFIFYPWRPQYLIPSIALFGLLAWYVITRNSAFMMGYFEPIIEWLTIAHGTIFEYLGTWGYLLYPVIGILGLFLIGVAYVFLFIPFLIGFLLAQMFVGLVLFGAGFTIVFLVTIVLFTVPAKLLGWFVNTNNERKLAWLGALLTILGFVSKWAL